MTTTTTTVTRVNWIKTDQNITVNYNGETHILSLTDSLAPKLLEALRNREYDKIPALVSKAKQIEASSGGKFVVRDNQIFVDNVAAPAALGKKILQFCDEGLPHEPLVEFARNLQKNPSFRSVQQLFSFLEKNDHPITDNGCFIAYKKVRSDFKDVHSGTFDNSVGQVVEMPRNQVNEDPNQTCSAGLHVANFDYASNFYAGGVMLEVEVNPADVVAVPTDYNESKMRVCRYKVLSVVEQEVSTPLRVTKPAPVVTHCDEDCDCEEEEDDYEDESEDEDYYDESSSSSEYYDEEEEEEDEEDDEEEVDYNYDEDKYPYEDELDQ